MATDRKIIALVLALVLSLTACGNAPAVTPQEDEEQEQTTVQPEEVQPVDDEQPVSDVAPDKTVSAQDESGAADLLQQDKAKTDSKADNETDSKVGSTKTEDSKTAASNYDNGNLTAAQVKELQRYYGVSADGQWGSGSASAAGGMSADSAWQQYQSDKQNQQTNTPSSAGTSTTMPSGSSSGNSSSGNSGSTVKPSTPSTPSTPSNPGTVTVPKANIDCVEAMRIGNEYAVSLGFEIWDEAASYEPPCYFEDESLLWGYELTQETFNNIMKSSVDSVKATLEKNGEWQPELEGWCMGINCVAYWDEARSSHVIIVYF